MLRTLVLFSLLAAASLACAPHKPKRHRNHHHGSHESHESHGSGEAPAKECTPLTTQWEKTACEAKLINPPSTTLKVSCDTGYQLFVKGAGEQAFGEAGPVDCDTSTQQWSYTYGGVKKTEADLTSQLQGGPLMFTCTKLKG
ncbi:hypothetical protein PRIPAC_83789 [Pristionchus pacificus]|uniref:Uncharacterized protein n=1 Tax=Pristionchus pacificus TaxID=54126 RepID=A0A454XLL5_PRIPA|nr:hypothetical protein PRIPAC_83789 [Pristionchus pacificus]|eukprot:PDM69053.1 hypothetical protein PRIPAC_47355 [Pristionchus pacificus]